MTVDPRALKLTTQLHLTMDPMAKDSSWVSLTNRTKVVLKRTELNTIT